MIIIKRIVTVVSAILGGAMGLILLALINWAFGLSLIVGHLLAYGIIGGAITGVLGSYLLTIYLMKKAKRFVSHKFMEVNGQLPSLKRV